ncbi:MAG: retropepsin-like aspartic protease [Planctomycetota bacterium]
MIPITLTRGVYGAFAHALSDTNSARIRLVVDTGASRTTLSFDTIDRLDLPVNTESIRSSTLAGDLHTPTAVVPRLAVGTRVLDSLEVLVADMPHGFYYDGLLGLDFLGSGTATFDFDRATLTLA